MTGCPNGCARPYMAELGFVGDGPNSYQVWIGGTSALTRLARPYAEKARRPTRSRLGRTLTNAPAPFSAPLAGACRLRRLRRLRSRRRRGAAGAAALHCRWALCRSHSAGMRRRPTARRLTALMGGGRAEYD